MTFEFGDLNHWLIVAKEMLANQYEQDQTQRVGVQNTTGIASRLGDIRRALDEQVDFRRGGYDVAR
jgi:hypothetical protein